MSTLVKTVPLVVLLAAVLAQPASASGVCPCSIWDSSAMPAIPAVSDWTPIEVGVKFKSEIDGYVIGARFYKGAANTGEHVAHLWSREGVLLAEALFVGESESGWQEVAFPSRIAITAETTYIISYHSAAGYFADTYAYFTSSVDNPPLHALADGQDGPNGVYVYSAGAGFPTQSYNASNYWVDVVFDTSAGVDLMPPTVDSVNPPDSSTAVPIQTSVIATFSEALDAGTVSTATFELRGPDNVLVPADVTYLSAIRRATLVPQVLLTNLTTYTARLKGGPTGIKDVAGNALEEDYVWSFTTASPPPDEGPGGPILVIAKASNPFTRYYAEILRNEGLNEFLVKDISTVTPEVLNAYDVVILGEMPLYSAQVTMLSEWVGAGGSLIAMRPDPQLAGLLGLTDAGTTLSNAYLLVNGAAEPGKGVVGETIQFHGTADRYTLSGATAIANLYADVSTPTANPAVTLRSVNPGGGWAAAFTYDLARSVVYTRQGNPAWAGQERDGQGTPIRSNDLFYGAAAGDPQPDWVNLDKVAIPQADEQQRLLVNLIVQMNRHKKPLPRFWYFPRGLKAVVIMTCDNHGGDGVAGRLDVYINASPPGCSVDDWECIRASSFTYAGNPLTDAQAASYTALGFEVGLHATSYCLNWTAASLESNYATQLAAWAAQYPSIPPQSSCRLHCIAWSDYATQPKVELNHGIRLDTNYYYWPPSWILDRPGMFTGSGMPMRFADIDGTIIDCYQAATQMTDESGQSYPHNIDTLLNRALGPEGYYGAFTANMHADSVNSSGSNAIVAAAQARGVPVVSGRQMLTWLDGRNGSSFGAVSWNANSLSFTITAAAGANGLRAMLPTAAHAGVLAGITLDGNPISYMTETIKGVQYAIFPATAGSYVASYPPDTTPPAISAVAASPSMDGTATITWTTDEISDSRVDYGTAPDALTLSATSAALVTAHSLELTGLTPDQTYHYRVTSKDIFGNSATWPASPAAPAEFTVPSASVVDTTAADFALGQLDGCAIVAHQGNGEITLAPTVDEEFAGTALPTGWSSNIWGGGGSASVAGGQLVVDGADAATDAAYGPGRSLEFVATFSGQPFQHVGFAANIAFDAPWAIFSTGASGNALYARTSATSNILISGAWIGSPHRFRIEWASSEIRFFIDETHVATQNAALAGDMRPIASDLAVGGGDLSVDWLRLTPYSPSCSFVSRVFDAGGPARWITFSWSAETPVGTSLAMNYRTGDSATLDETWTAFASVAAPGAAISASSRYIQYRADLATTAADLTPVLLDVTIGYATISNQPPTITSQPIPLAVVDRGVAVFTVAAEGAEPLHYRWRKGGQDLTDGGSISGAATNTLTINPVVWTDAGSYDVVVTDAHELTVDSDAVALTVNPRRGDMDCDGDIDDTDAALFVDALLDTALFDAAHPTCLSSQADMDGDTLVNGADVQLFVAALLST